MGIYAKASAFDPCARLVIAAAMGRTQADPAAAVFSRSVASRSGDHLLDFGLLDLGVLVAEFQLFP